MVQRKAVTLSVTQTHTIYTWFVREIGRNDEESRGSLVEGFGSIATLECVQTEGTWQALKQWRRSSTRCSLNERGEYISNSGWTPSVPGDLLVLNLEIAKVTSLREICESGNVTGSKSGAGREPVVGSGTDHTCSER